MQKNSRGRLDLAIVLLPSETAVALAGNQFLPHGFGDITAWANLAAFGGMFRQWLAETMPREPFDGWRWQLQRRFPQPYFD